MSDAPAPGSSPDGWLDLEATARRLGHYRWWAAALFEVLGGWVAVEPDPAVKLLLAAHCQQQAGAVAAWRDLQPTLPHLDPDRLTRPPHAAAAALVAGLAGFDVPEAGIERLTAVHRVVLPCLVAAFAAHRAGAQPAADGPVVRALDRIGGDAREAAIEGERALQRLLVDAAAVGRAGAVHVRVETSLVEAGGIV